MGNGLFNWVQILLAKSGYRILAAWLKGKNSEVTLSFNALFELQQIYRPTLLISVLFDLF